MQERPGGPQKRQRNVFGEPLVSCSERPLTGFYRSGCCHTGPEDVGLHTVCIEATAEFNLIGIKAEDGNPAEESEGEGIVPYFALTPIGVTEDNIADTVIKDGFRTVAEVCKGDTAQTDFCKEQS